MDFKDKVILITGAGSGIGREVALQFANYACKIVVADINDKLGKETLAAVEEKEAEGIFIQVDVSDYSAMEKMTIKIIDTYGRLDIGINNAGISGELARLEHASNENWDKVMAINANGVFYGMKLQVRQMLKQGGGVILNTASVAGLKGLPNGFAYTASKHAVVGMTKTAAMEYARKNIRVNAICPVFTVTALFNPEKMDSVSDGLSEKLRKGIPMKRFGKVEEVARTMLYLCSDDSGFITGQSIAIDGGLTA